MIYIITFLLILVLLSSKDSLLKLEKKFQIISKSYKQKTMLYKRKKLLEDIFVLIICCQQQGIISSINLPRYKFFTTLIEQLLHMNRSYGVICENNLKSIRRGLIQDDQFEQKLSKLKKSSFLQFVSVSLITWLFVYASTSMLEIKISSIQILSIGLLEVLGLICFNVLYHYYKKKQFYQFSDYLESLYLFQNLLLTGMPIKNLLEKSKILELLDKRNKKFVSINDSIKISLEKMQNNGVDIADQISDAIEEIWFLMELEFDQFCKTTGGLKLLILPVFFLSGYFLYLYNLIGQAMV